MKRFFWILLISQGILFLFIFYAGFWMGQKYGTPEKPVLLKKTSDENKKIKDSYSNWNTPAFTTLSLGKNQFLMVRGNLFFLCALDEKENLKIKKVFAFRYDPQRFPKDVNQIALHHYYFDNIEIPILKILHKKEKRFLDLGKQSPYILDYTLEAIQIAEELASYGDIKFLLPFLKEKYPYRLQKAAALALGKRGYIQGIPILITMAKEKNLAQRQKVFSLLRRLTGLDIPQNAKGEKVFQILEKVRQWYQEKK